MSECAAKTKINLAQTADAVCPERDRSFTLDEVDFRMVDDIFGHFSNTVYKVKRVLKIIELKRLLEPLVTDDLAINIQLIAQLIQRLTL